MEEKETLDQLRGKFLKLFTKKEQLVTSGITSAYVLYTNLIGRDEFEVFNLKIRVKALRLKIKLAQAYLNRDEAPDTHAIEYQISQMWKKHEDELRRMMEGIKYSDSCQVIQQPVVEDCRTIYRMLVKKLHPDLHPELSDELHDMLIIAQAAYKQYDVKTLRQLVIKYHFLSEQDSTEKDINISNLINQLHEQIEILERQIEEYENNFPLNYLERLHDKSWVEEQQGILLESRKKYENDIIKLEEMYSLMTD